MQDGRQEHTSEVSGTSSHARGAKVGYLALLVASVGVLALFVLGLWGTVPPTVSSISGKHAVVLPNGNTLISLDVSEDGSATVVYRGITMTGKLGRGGADQESTGYGLTVKSSSMGDPKRLQFSITVPTAGLDEFPAGALRMTLRNTNVPAPSDDHFGDYLLFDVRDETVENADFSPGAYDEAEEPYELFDWIEFNADGTALAVSKDFMVDSMSTNGLRDAGRPLTWVESDGIVTLSE